MSSIRPCDSRARSSYITKKLCNTRQSKLDLLHGILALTRVLAKQISLRTFPNDGAVAFSHNYHFDGIRVFSLGANIGIRENFPDTRHRRIPLLTAPVSVETVLDEKRAVITGVTHFIIIIIISNFFVDGVVCTPSFIRQQRCFATHVINDTQCLSTKLEAEKKRKEKIQVINFSFAKRPESGPAPLYLIQ